MANYQDNFLKKTVNVIILLFIITFALVYFIEPPYEFDEDGLEASLEFDEDELKDDVWQIEEIFDDIVTVSVNGKVVHGDKYRVYFTPVDEEWCHNPQSSTTLLSVVENAEEKFNNLPSNVLLASINNERVLFEITDVNDFLEVVKNAFVNMGVMHIDDLINYYQDFDEIEIEILAFYNLDEDKILEDNINDYFAFPKNIYSLTGFEEAMNTAKNMCLASVSEEIALD